MPDRSFRVTIITPTERLLDAEATYAEVPLHDGQMGVMPMRAPIVGKLGPGELRLELASGSTKRWYIDGGFAQHVGGALTVLSTGAVAVSDLDVAQERAALAEANARRSSDAEEMDTITEQRHKASTRVRLATNA